MVKEKPEYDIAKIRELLCAAFEPEELRRFCRDRPLFSPVAAEFAPGHGLNRMVDRVIDYCERQLLIDELLAEVQGLNPRQYARFEAAITGQPPPTVVVKSVDEETTVYAETDAIAPETPTPSSIAHAEPNAVPPETPASATAILKEEKKEQYAIPHRAWGLLVLLAVNLVLVFFWLWCLLRDHPELVNYLEMVFGVLALFLAILTVVFALQRVTAWEKAMRRLGTRQSWAVVVLALTVVNVFLTIWLCRWNRPPTVYMEIILDNGPVPEMHQLEELKGVLHRELAHALPEAALALRVFGLRCGDTRQVVTFRTGNAEEMVEAVRDVYSVGRADLAEAIRQALNDLLQKPGDQPRVAIVITWGKGDCGGDLQQILAKYERQLGRVVTLHVINLGPELDAIGQPGVYVGEAADVQQVSEELSRINQALAGGAWPPPTPTDTPCPAGSLCNISEDLADGTTFLWEWPEYSGLATISHVYNKTCGHSGGVGLMLEYRFAAGQDSHCGWGVTWQETPARHFDASGFSFLIFQVRVESGSGTFDIGLADMDSPEVKRRYEVEDTGGFVEAEIPLSYYTSKGVNLAELQKMSFGFSSAYGPGTICIDAIEFR